jgi:excisionase family DNA binding protein
MTSDESLEPLLTAAEVAVVLGIAVGTVRNWAAQKRLPSAKLNGALRFRPSDLRQWIGRCHRPVQDERLGLRVDCQAAGGGI